MCNAKVQFIILNYKTANLTVRCVNSMTVVGIPEHAILVVDNLSSDNSVAFMSSLLPRVRIVQTNHNGGYGAGVNVGVGHTNSEYVVILNPDTLFISNITDELFSIFENDPSIAIVGLNLLNPDLKPQYSARHFYSFLDIVIRRTKLKTVWPFKILDDRHLMKEHFTSKRSFDADWVMGTGFAVRKAVFDQLGGMDERYFLYMEDVDLCARVWAAGYRVICSPGLAIIHDHQRASAKSPFSKAAKTHLLSLKHFTTKFRIPFFYMRRREQVLRRGKRS
jgi:N-acetylglucosaminyl-diphospho-decaprenol L-rhamnosyltransferase